MQRVICFDNSSIQFNQAAKVKYMNGFIKSIAALRILLKLTYLTLVPQIETKQCTKIMPL